MLVGLVAATRLADSRLLLRQVKDSRDEVVRVVVLLLVANSEDAATNEGFDPVRPGEGRARVNQGTTHTHTHTCT